MQPPADRPPPQPPAAGLALRLNGTLLRLPPAGAEASPLDVPLRGVALSDSPVLIRGDDAGERVDVATRLHALGRRKDRPLHVCASEAEAAPLLELVAADEPSVSAQRLAGAGDRIAGTWALGDVGRWSRAQQAGLVRLLKVLDEHRLHERIPHDRIPRIIVMEPADDGDGLDADLEQRLSFFELVLGAAAERQKRAAPRRKSKAD